MRRAQARRAAPRHRSPIIPFLAISTLLLAQPSPKEAAAERANVRRIAARIQTRGKDARRAYRVTIPNTTVSYDMVAIPAGEFVMGSHAGKDEQPPHKVRLDAFWMQTHEVTWDEYRLFMFAAQAGETGRPDETVDAVSRPTRPYVEMSFGMGIHGFPAISMTQHAANKYAEWLSARTGEFYRLPTEAEWEYACRAGDVGRSASPAVLSDFAWYAGNSGGKYHEGRNQEAECLGPLRHARQRHGVDARPLRALPAGRCRQPLGASCHALSARRARRFLERSGGPC